jgi:RNA polymerase sigma-70 factor, ECF subfamily
MEVQYWEEASTRTELTPEAEFGAGHEALGQVFSRHKDHLYRIAFRVLGSREEAEDAVQDGLLAATRNLKSFEGRSQFSTWLTRVVINAALMRRRKMRGYTTTSIDRQYPDEGGLSLADKIADSRPDPEETYAREEHLTMVRRGLETLPASYRSALWLRDVEGMSTQEAAQALRISEGTVKSRLHRARLEFSRRVHEAVPAPVHTGRTTCKSRNERLRSTGIIG